MNIDNSLPPGVLAITTTFFLLVVSVASDASFLLQLHPPKREDDRVVHFLQHLFCLVFYQLHLSIRTSGTKAIGGSCSRSVKLQYGFSYVVSSRRNFDDMAM